jgi:branched-chain amino acid transport system ATP-binding protein
MLNLPFTWGEERRIRERSFEILELLGIADSARAEATSLAYGQQRVVELGRALACEPQLLLLDEPAAGLNMRETMDMGRLIAKVRGMGITVLLVEQNFRFAATLADRHYVMERGKIVDEIDNARLDASMDRLHEYLGV